ncbi:MAG: hypothetical protein JW873_00460 [Candidatus Saganbacteria bacterium]|nr:hypothetical protein [Candidatus Saganbacteria bacterium]
MKKALSLLLFLALCASVAQAQSLIGGRAAGMGGAGVAASNDLSAAYYNPAALMRSKVVVTEVKIDLGAAYTDPTTLSNALSKATDPASFLLSNYANNLNFTGSLFGLIGVNVRKIGLSVIPVLTTTVNKPANSLGGTAVASGHYDAVLTLGTTFAVPRLPAALDVGVNLKALNGVAGSMTVSSAVGQTTATGNQDTGTGTGMGYDIGVLTSFNVPYVSKVAVGAVVRNLSTSYTLKMTRQAATLNQLTGTVSFGASTALPDQTVNIDSSTAVGAYATIPVIGAGVAADLEMTKTDTNTHLGIEYPMLYGLLVLRAGAASGPNLSLTTAGLELNLAVTKLGIVTVADAKNSGATTTVADITIGF